MRQPESAAGSLGAHLRSLREAKQSSLEDMARSTRVGIRHLEALEEERLADLPSPVFVRGFIRAYCGFLRENPRTALDHYQALAGAQAAAAAASAPPRARTTWATSSVVVGLALLVVLGAGLVALNLAMKRTGGTSVAATKVDDDSAPEPIASPAKPEGARKPETMTSAPAPGPVPAPTPAQPGKPSAPQTGIPEPARLGSPPATSSAVAPMAKAEPGAPLQRLTIRAVEPSWIRVQTDDGRVVEELLSAGASREWTTERRFVVTIGNAGGVEVTLNGKVLPALGGKGTVIQRLELPPAPTTSGS
ncbi:MAG TPA: helix-turn-helix domain-containing protein [Methylomirabilota bacterium]|jgi:cytoskeletal protein RodZ